VIAAGDLLNDVADLYAPVAEERGIELRVSAGPAEVVGDRALLRRALANLADNALKYTSPGGRVELSARRTAGEVTLEVADTGSGVEPEDLPRIWDRHFRGDASRHTRGLGLGLSLVRALVEAHGGRVSVVSTPGAGSTFSIHLPARP
jgi:signal transduction histidine kinase